MALISSAGCASADLDEISKGVAFRFNPPDGITFTETSKHTTKFSLHGIASKPGITTTQAKITIKKTDKGYRATRIPIYYKVEGNTNDAFGDPSEAAIVKFLDCSVLEYELDKQGGCIGVVGVEKLIDKIEVEVRKVAPRGAHLPPSILMAMIRSAEAIEIARWDYKFCMLTGRFMNVGESVKISTPKELAISGDLIKTDCVLKLAELVKVGGKQLAKIQYSSSLDSETLCDWYNKLHALMFSDATDSTHEVVEVSSAGEQEKIEYTIDPSTQLPYSISSKSTTKIVGSVSDESNIQILYEDWQQYSYEYSK